MRKIRYTLCLLIGWLCSMGVYADETFDVGPYTYIVTSNTATKKTVSLKSANLISKNMVVPDEVKNPNDDQMYKVTAIKGAGGSGAFINKHSLETVVLGVNVTKIEADGFFGCDNLRSIDLKNVTIIEKTAFSGCKSLQTLQSDFVKEVGLESFEGCTSLTSINFPNIEKIGASAFLNCTALSDITISEAPEINFKSFENTAWLNGQPNGMVYLNKVLYTYKGTVPYNSFLEVRDDTKRISGWAFEHQNGLKSINIKNVKYLDSEVFSSCDGLRKITTWETTPPAISDVSHGLGRGLHYDQMELYVPEGYENVYRKTDQWNKCKFINGGEAPIENIYELNDNVAEFTNKTSRYYNQIQYTRNYKHTKWQPLFVPYSIKFEDLAGKFDIARLNNVHQYDDNDDGVFEITTIEIIRLKKGVTEPNMPYVIRAKQTGEQTITTSNVYLEPTKITPIECANFTSTFTFTGTYSLYKGTGHYVMGGGSIHPLTVGKAGPGAFRWYMTVQSREGDINYAPKKIYLVEEGEDLTGLEEMAAPATTFDIYNMNGQLVKKAAENMEGLPKGIYIVNGQKVIK